MPNAPYNFDVDEAEEDAQMGPTEVQCTYNKMLVALECKVFITTCTYLHVIFQTLYNLIHMCDAWNYISSLFSSFHSYNETRAPKDRN